MTRHLLFTLFAPMGAWGSPSLSAANQAWKTTELEPTRSALVGLLGAGLGWGRERLGALDADLSFAVRVDLAPTRDPQPDYHTITPAQPPPGRDRWTRFEELRSHLTGGKSEGSILSRREYWTAGLWTVAVHARGNPTDEDMAKALCAPVWPLYVGRKACALGLPPDPEVIEAADLAAAFCNYGLPWTRHPALRDALASVVALCPEHGGSRLLLDLDYPDAPTVLRRVERRDRPDHALDERGQLVRRFHTREVGEVYLPEVPAS